MCSRPAEVEARWASVAIAEPFVLHVVERLCAHPWNHDQMGSVDWVCVLWKEMNARGLRPGPATFGCMAEGPNNARAARRGLEADLQPCGL